MYLILSMYGPSIVWNLKYLEELRHSENMASAMFIRGEYFSKQKTLAHAFRAFYILRIVILPWLVAGTPFFMSLMLVPVVCGSILTFLFVLSHNFEGVDREPCKDGETDWYKAQAETSGSYGGFFGMFFTGGLNFQIEHHLFPRMSSWYYPQIAPIVKKCCEDHGVTYAYYPYIWENMVSCVKYMQEVGDEVPTKTVG
jgi:fatty acid desaturase